MDKIDDIYKTKIHVFYMKLKDIFGKISKNKRNGQLTTCIRKNNLKKIGINEKQLFNMNINSELKEILFEE